MYTWRMTTIAERFIAAVTGRMKDEEWRDICGAVSVWSPQQETAILTEAARARRVEQEQAEKMTAMTHEAGRMANEISSLKEQNDALTAQVRGVSMVNRDDALARSEMAEAIARQERVIASLREQLRLTNDKMAEQVRQARVGVAEEALALWEKGWEPCLTFLEAVRDANAPKD